MERRLLKKIFAVGLAAAMTFASVPFVSGMNGAVNAEAADSTTSDNTVKVKYNVQINQTLQSIEPVFNLVKNYYDSLNTTTSTASDGTAASSGTNTSSITYNSTLESAAIERAEDLVVYDASDGLRPDGSAGETVLDSVTSSSISTADKSKFRILTYSGTSAPDAAWLSSQNISDFAAQSVAIGHVTSDDSAREFYCIILTTYKENGQIDTSKSEYISPVKCDVSQNHIDSIYAASSDDGINYSTSIKFTDNSGYKTAALSDSISVAVGESAKLPTIKYQVSTKSSSGSSSGSTSGQLYDLDASSVTNASNSPYASDTTGISVSDNQVTGKKVGSYTVTFEAQIAGSRTLLTLPVTVTAADISGAKISFTDGKTYYANGTAAEPNVSVTLNGTTLKKDTDYTVSYANNNPANSVTTDQTATVTVTGKGNYTGTATATFTIHPSSGGSLASATITVTEKNITYDGKEKKPKITVTLQDVTVPEASYTVKYANNIKAGTANIIVTAKSGDQRYTGVAKGTFTIAPADLASADFTFSDSDNKSSTNPQYSYTGADVKPEPEIKVGSETLKKGTDFTYSYSNNKAIGATATVTITGKGNYTGTAFAYFEITQGNISKATITPTPSTFTYNGQRQYPSVVVVSIGSHQLVQGKDYTISAFPDSVDAGDYSFTITGINNFKGTGTTTTTTTSTTSTTSSSATGTTTANTGVVTGTYTINAKNAKSLYKKTNGISVSAVSSKTYTGKAIKPSIIVTDDALGTVLSSSTDYTRTDSNNTTLGTAKISLAFKGNYTGTINISYKILPKKTSISKVTAGKKKATVTYKKVSGITGYQVKCGTNKTVTSGTKTKNTTKTKYTMKSLKKGKRYYFKIRTYFTTASGSKVYSSWSNVKSAKVK
jgi:hypothetical protein